MKSDSICSSKLLILLLVILLTIIIVHIALNSYNKEMFNNKDNIYGNKIQIMIISIQDLQ